MRKEKKKKVYKKPAFEVEEIFERTSLACSSKLIAEVCEITGPPQS